MNSLLDCLEDEYTKRQLDRELQRYPRTPLSAVPAHHVAPPVIDVFEAPTAAGDSLLLESFA